MNPNSANQVWSRWTFIVRPDVTARPVFADVRANCARFGRKAFGSATEMRVEQRADRTWLIDVRTEGAPIQDDAYVADMVKSWKRFFRGGFGVMASVTATTKLEAGSPQTGAPSDQLIIVPPIVIEELTHG